MTSALHSGSRSRLEQTAETERKAALLGITPGQDVQ